MTQQTDHVPDKKVTSVEWLEAQLMELISFNTAEMRELYRNKFKQAKAMEKEQIKYAHENGQGVVHNPYAIWRISDKAEEYYNELYNK